MSENNERNFDLGTVLSITTGRVFTEFGNIYKILNYLSRDNLFTNQLPRVVEIAQPYILARYPQLLEEMCEHINPIKEAEQMNLSRTKNL